MPAFTSRHYGVIAKVLHGPELSEEQRIALASRFADLFEEDNPERFSRRQFGEACFADFDDPGEFGVIIAHKSGRVFP